MYTARSDAFETLQGTIEADSRMEAVELLSRQGHYPLAVESDETAHPANDMFRFWRVPRKDVVTLTRHLAILLGSGVNIISSLDLINSQVTNTYLRSVVLDIRDRIQKGSSLSECLAAYPALFSPLYVALIRSGEIGGNLDETLKRLSDFEEREEELKDELLAALTYPLFVSAVGAVTMVVLIGFVMPRLIGMFADMGQALPLPTLVLIGASHVMRSYWWLIAGLLGLGTFAFIRYYRTEAGRLHIDGLKMRTVLIKDVVIKTEISRFMRTLSLLLGSGIETLTALDVTSSVLKNSVLKREAGGFKDRIIKGASLSQCLKEARMFPPFVTNIVAVGEESGTLEQSLMSIAREYERDAERMLKVLTRLLEPAIILVMGIVIGFIVLAMLLPIFQMNLMVR
jgi:type II secretory pathway component PulF